MTSLITVGDARQGSRPTYWSASPTAWARSPASSPANGDYVADKAYMTVFREPRAPAGHVRRAARARPADGAFVSQWTVHLNTLQVKWGEDLIQRVLTWQ
ncbi:MAG: hypothetical protein MZV70_39765 [Desulfobacterales bacterium]|nr:hypothetical protein [Desulfobacterales bacterium]